MNDQMEYAKRMVEFLGKVLGKNYEIVLQDIPEQKIVAIANGGVSGRKVGSPLTDLALKMIADKEWEKNDCKLNYLGMTNDGRLLRSSTYFIRENGNLLGMLCINIDISKIKEAGDVLYYMAGLFDMPGETGKSGQKINEAAKLTGYGKDVYAEEKPRAIENFSVSLTDMISSTVKKELENYGNIPVSRLSKNERIQIIEKLDTEGVFLMKGAVSIVAQELDCAESTLYRYLSKMR